MFPEFVNDKNRYDHDQGEEKENILKITKIFKISHIAPFVYTGVKEGKFVIPSLTPISSNISLSGGFGCDSHHSERIDEDLGHGLVMPVIRKPGISAKGDSLPPWGGGNYGQGNENFSGGS